MSPQRRVCVSYRAKGTRWTEMEGSSFPGYSGSSWKQKGGFGGVRVAVTGDRVVGAGPIDVLGARAY